jgi:menaquinone-dependent protoporphyrinogen IX oxidase
LAFLSLIIGCQTDLATIEEGNLSATKRVLIAGTMSNFKQKVADGLVKKLGIQDYYFKITGLNQLAKENTEQYGATVLIASFEWGRIDRRVTQFLQKNPANQKVIVLYTVGAEKVGIQEWANPDRKVDAVTSASSLNRVEERVDELAVLVKAKFDVH